MVIDSEQIVGRYARFMTLLSILEISSIYADFMIQLLPEVYWC